MSRFYFEYAIDGADQFLELQNAEELTPNQQETGTDATAVNGEQERLHFRTEHTLTIRTRGVKECDMPKWMAFFDATKCGTLTLRTGGRLSWAGWDGANVTRQREYNYSRDGKGLWQISLGFRRND